MRFCTDHWDRLRTAIADRGMDDLVSGDGNELMLRIGGGGFDPLMGAHLAIISQLAHTAGPGILLIPGCPLCEANTAHAQACTEPSCGRADLYDDWLGYAADEQLEQWKTIQAAAGIGGGA